MSALSKEDLIAAIQSDAYGYYPYSSEDTFELCRSETTRYSVFRVPVDFVKSFPIFAAQSFVGAFGAPNQSDCAHINVAATDRSAIARHLRWLDSTDDPNSLKFKAVALRGCETFHEVAEIGGRDCCRELIVAKTDEFYVSFLWFTSG